MKTPDILTRTTLSRAYATYNGSKLTNASFRWHPGADAAENTIGRLMVGLGNPNVNVNVGLFPSSTHKGLVALLMYSHDKTEFSEEMPVAQNEPVNLELDIDPKTSNVVMWVNDKGYDMGVLPGFKGGATKAIWCIAGHAGVKLPAGKITDCAVGTAKGWKAPVFLDEHITDHELHENHLVTFSGRDPIAIGNQRNLV